MNLPSGCVVDPHWLGNESHPAASIAGALRQDQTVLSEIRPSWCDDIKRKAHLYTIYTTYYVLGRRRRADPQLRPLCARSPDPGRHAELRDRCELGLRGAGQGRPEHGLGAVFNAAARVNALKLSASRGSKERMPLFR